MGSPRFARIGRPRPHTVRGFNDGNRHDFGGRAGGEAPLALTGVRGSRRIGDSSIASKPRPGADFDHGFSGNALLDALSGAWG